jgi:hypothetical protein
MKTGIDGDVVDDMLKVAQMAEETYGPYTSTGLGLRLRSLSLADILRKSRS